MSDIQTPKADFIFGKTGAEAAALLTKLSDSTEVAKQMKLLYSDAQITAIFNSGKMSPPRMVGIIDSASYTADQRATLVEDIGPGAGATLLMSISVADAKTIVNNAIVTAATLGPLFNNLSTDFFTEVRLRWHMPTRRIHVWMSVGAGDLITARRKHAVCGGNAHSFIAAGGLIKYGAMETPTASSDSEYYDSARDYGTWSAGYGVYDMITARYEHSFDGTNTSSILCGGVDSDDNITGSTEERTPISSAGADLGTAICRHVIMATSASSAISCGGWNGTATELATEKYNGTAWSSDDDMNAPRNSHGGCGTAASAIIAGSTTSYGQSTELYNGTTWSNWLPLNTSVVYSCMMGTPSAGWSTGGYLSSGDITAECEYYDGSAWTVSGIGDLNTNRRYHSGSFTVASDSCLVTGGSSSIYDSSFLGDTEEMV